MQNHKQSQPQDSMTHTNQNQGWVLCLQIKPLEVERLNFSHPKVFPSLFRRGSIMVRNRESSVRSKHTYSKGSHQAARH